MQWFKDFGSGPPRNPDNPPPWGFAVQPVELRVDPTATALDAARLYGELRAKAEEEVIGEAVLRLNARNSLHVVKYSLEGNMETGRRMCKLAFELNEVIYRVEAYADEEGMRHEIVQRLVKILAAEITDKLMRKGS